MLRIYYLMDFDISSNDTEANDLPSQLCNELIEAIRGSPGSLQTPYHYGTGYLVSAIFRKFKVVQISQILAIFGRELFGHLNLELTMLTAAYRHAEEMPLFEMVLRGLSKVSLMHVLYKSTKKEGHLARIVVAEMKRRGPKKASQVKITGHLPFDLELTPLLEWADELDVNPDIGNAKLPSALHVIDTFVQLGSSTTVRKITISLYPLYCEAQVYGLDLHNLAERIKLIASSRSLPVDKLELDAVIPKADAYHVDLKHKQFCQLFVCESLHYKPSLQLGLHGFTLPTATLTHLFFGHPSQPCELHLKNINVTDDTPFIAPARVTSSFQKVTLSMEESEPPSANITKYFTSTFMEQLGKMPSLKHLDIGGCLCPQENIHPMVVNILDNNTVHHLTVHSGALFLLSATDREQLEDKLSSNTSLTQLTFGGAAPRFWRKQIYKTLKETLVLNNKGRGIARHRNTTTSHFVELLVKAAHEPCAVAGAPPGEEMPLISVYYSLLREANGGIWLTVSGNKRKRE
jgi:hypothetical protein